MVDSIVRPAVLALLATLRVFQDSPPAPAPVDEKTLAAEAAAQGGGLTDELRRALENRLRVLDVAAHPDDEDGALLAKYSLDGAQSFVAYATDGAGGQNAIGDELGAELGARRIDETLAANGVVGATATFLGFEDFGFSKRADEAFTRWGGRDEVVHRLVRVIRRVRPHLVFTNHPQQGGHGHHQAVAIALQEAISAAADPARYTEDVGDSDAANAPWRADALFVRTTAKELAPATTLAFDYDTPLTGAKDDKSAAGRTLAKLAHDALLCHASQGPWADFDPKAQHTATYVMTWCGLTPTPATSALPLHRVALPETAPGTPFTIDSLFAAMESGPPGDAPSEEARNAWARALLGFDLFFLDEDPLAPRRAVAPGETLTYLALLHGRDPLYRGAACAEAIGRLTPKLRLVARDGAIASSVELPFEQLFAEEERDAWRGTFVAARAETIAPAASTVPIRFDGRTPAWRRFPLEVEVELTDSQGHPRNFRLPIEKSIAPAARLAVEPAPAALLRRRLPTDRPAFDATLHLTFPTGRVPLGELELTLSGAFEMYGTIGRISADGSDGSEDRSSFPFTLDPAENLGTPAAPRFELPFRIALTPKTDASTAGVTLEGGVAITFADGTPIASAPLRAGVLDAIAPKGVQVAFVPGSDRTLALALAALRVPKTRLEPEALGAIDAKELSRFTTIVLDLRTLGTSEPLRQASAKLRDFSAQGGHVVVLYHKSGEWNDFAKAGLTPAPLPFELSDSRVVEEDAPVRVLRPADPLLLEPNVLLASDFDGWVQERGLYFPKADHPPEYLELLSMADRDEEPLKTALLEWRGEKGGTFVYCALALHRQLRAGNRGAFKLLANLVGQPRGH